MNWVSLISIGISLLITGFNAALWIVVKFNDLAHLERSVKEITELLKDVNKKLDDNGERIAKLEGRCAANHGG
jgi:Cu/Ag efflux pump CusA